MSEKEITRRAVQTPEGLWKQISGITQYLKDNVWPKSKEKKE